MQTPNSDRRNSFPDKASATRPFAALLAEPHESHQKWRLDAVVEHWARERTPLPIAVVHSIFDDVCTSLAEGGTVLGPRSTPLGLEHVVIDHMGRARLIAEPTDAVGELSSLLYQTLTEGVGDDAVPPAIRPILAQSASPDPLVRPTCPEPLRASVRMVLGTPAPHDEVAQCCALATTNVEWPRDVLEVPSMVSSAPDDAAPVLAFSEPDLSEDVDLGSLLPKPRRVVRHQIQPTTPISLPTAPQARVGPATLAPDERTSDIIFPSESKGHAWLIACLLAVAAGIVAWLFGFFP